MNAIDLLGTSPGEGFGRRARLGGPSRPIFPAPCLLVDLTDEICHAWLIGEDGHRVPPSLRLQLADFPSVIGLIGGFVERISPVVVRSMLIAIPGPALKFRTDFTNSGRIIDCMEIYRRFGLESGMLLNDQEAAAFCVPISVPGKSLISAPPTCRRAPVRKG